MNKLQRPIVFSRHIYPSTSAIIEAIIHFQKIHYYSILKTKINLNDNKKKNKFNIHHNKNTESLKCIYDYLL